MGGGSCAVLRQLLLMLVGNGELSWLRQGGNCGRTQQTQEDPNKTQEDQTNAAMAQHAGKLALTVEFAQDLKSKDVFDRTDPYCTVSSGLRSSRRNEWQRKHSLKRRGFRNF